jgi:hypothetical protein
MLERTFMDIGFLRRNAVKSAQAAPNELGNGLGDFGRFQ